MNKVCLTIVGIIGVLWPVGLFAEADIAISGLAVFPYWQVGTQESLQFDQAVNLDANWKISPKVDLFINLQSGVGYGRLGFQGPQIVVTDVGMRYALSEGNVVMGSFDMPFGQEVDQLTNNGSLGGSGFVLNPLLYTALAGPAGTLNTVGVMLTRPVLGGLGQLFVSNGTGETAVSEGKSLAYGGSWTMPIARNTEVGISAFRSNDRSDASNTNADSLKADTSAYLVDIQSEGEGYRYGCYLGQLWFGNGTTAADLVTVGMVSGEIAGHGVHWRARASYWFPQDQNGDGLGISSRVPDPGMGAVLGDIPPIDRCIIRYQCGVSAPLEDGVLWGVEAFLDDVDHGNQALGVLSYLSAEVSL